MAKYTMRAGGEFDTLNAAELDQLLTKTSRTMVQEQARGVSTAPLDGQGTVSAGTVNIPDTGSANRMGPKAGFAWKIRRINAVGLLSGDSLNVYRDTVSPHNFLGVLSATNVLPQPTNSIILRGDQHLVIQGLSLTAVGDIVINGEVTEVPEPDLYKLL